ncbi:MAG: glycosyltransferase family 2 protein [Cyanobacteriota bacterium]
MLPPLSVITVTHNHAPYIGRCLKALIPEVKKIQGEIIVIDNRSDDDSADRVRQFSEVRLYVNPERRGFSANNNVGMALAQGRYLLLLNPDTEVLPGALAALLAFMESHPQVGLCGAQLLFPDGTIQPSPRRFPTWQSALARRTPLRVFLKNSALNRHHLMFDLDHSQPQPVDWLLGACLLVRREILTTVGPLDEGFFLYVEDIDWAKRIHQQGWQVYYVPTAQIVHHHLAVSDKRWWSRYTVFHLQSMLRYVRKHLLPPWTGLAITAPRTTLWEETGGKGED